MPLGRKNAVVITEMGAAPIGAAFVDQIWGSSAKAQSDVTTGKL